MLLLFAAGIMNLVWIAGLAVLVLIEKLAPFGANLAPLTAALAARRWTLRGSRLRKAKGPGRAAQALAKSRCRRAYRE